MRKLLLAATAAAALQGGGAQAALVDVTADPVAIGPITVVFAFEEAWDRSKLQWSQGLPFADLIDNQADPIGLTIAGFGAAGPVTFRLANQTTGSSFDTGVLVGGIFHAKASANFADFGVGALPAAAAAAIAAIGEPGIFIGFEDRALSQRSDRDFNDLIYFFTSISTGGGDPNVIPAPAALGLFGAGLLGLAAFRRRA